MGPVLELLPRPVDSLTLQVGAEREAEVAGLVVGSVMVASGSVEAVTDLAVAAMVVAG